MDELRQEVRAAAMARFASYADRAPADVPEFKRAGVQMLLFAQEEPRLYQLLFVNGSREAASFADVFGELGPMAEHCVAAIRRDYALSDEDARLLLSTCGSIPSAWGPSAPEAPASPRSGCRRCSPPASGPCCCWPGRAGSGRAGAARKAEC